MTHTFDSEVSLHFWSLWPTVRRRCDGAASCLPKIYVGGPVISSAVLRDVLQTSSKAKICFDVNRNVHFLTYPRGVLYIGTLGVFYLT